MTTRYVGAYGVLVRDGAVLLVKKMRGPYEGSLDLPGGALWVRLDELDQRWLSPLAAQGIAAIR